MGEVKHTPGPWKAREMARNGEIRGYFVAAPDVNGFAYDAEILGEDEYRDEQTGMARWRADAHLAAAAPELLEMVKAFVSQHAKFGPWDELLGESEQTRSVNQAIALIAKAEGRTP